MTMQNNELLSDFVAWANAFASRCKPSVVVEVQYSPRYEKQSAWIDLADGAFVSRIQIWDSGEYEMDHRNLEEDEVPLIFEYGENVSAFQFEQLFSRITNKYLA
jgi:hypothetical protein